MDSDDRNHILEPFADGVVAIDRDFKIISFSEGAERITGFTIAAATGANCRNIFKSELCGNKSPLSNVLKGGKSLTNVKTHIKNTNNETVNVILHATPLKSIKGDTIGAIITFRDIEETFRLHAKLYKDNARLHAILHSITDGVLTVDKEWRVTSFNPAAEKITGFTMEEVIGKHCYEILRSETCKENCPLRKTMQTDMPVYDYAIEIINVRGETVPISVNTALLIDESGDIVGGVETFRDLSTYVHLREELNQRYSFGNIIGKDKKMREIYNLLKAISATDTTVLIMGETGTGKELIARAIHHNSPRKHKPFLKVDCTALPETLLESELFGYKKGAFTDAKADKPGKFELADGGTIFLDEIGDLPPSIQSKLLRVLEEHAFEPLGAVKTVNVDVRVVTATNRDLHEAIKQNRFRKDLYYRLNVVPITIPPLRRRPEDIPLLIDHFVDIFGRKFGKTAARVSQDAIDILVDYEWPGNVRQLEHAIEHAFIHCRGRMIQAADLPEDIKQKQSPLVDRILDTENPMQEVEREIILEALKRNNWNYERTSRALRISYVTLWRKMRKFNIKKP